MPTYHCNQCDKNCVLIVPEKPISCPLEWTPAPDSKWEEVSTKFEDWQNEGLDNRNSEFEDEFPYGCIHYENERCVLHGFGMRCCYDPCVHCIDFKVIR